MIRLGRRRGWWTIALATLALVVGLRAMGEFERLENAVADQRARWLSHEVRSDIVIVGIDAASLGELDQWPWPRRHHARLIEQLARSAPNSVFLDVDLSATSNAIDDALLESALAKPRDFPVKLPMYIRYAGGADRALVVREPRPRFSRRAERVVVDATPGSDGLTRTWRTSWAVGDARAPSVIDPQRRLPDQHEVIIDFSISPASFQYVSYVDVLEGRVPREQFAGKTVFVGGTALELGDLVPVPVHGSLPGVVVQALAAETVIRGPPRLLPGWLAIGLLAFWTWLAAFAFGRRWVRNLGVLMASMAAIAAVSSLALEAGRWMLETVAPMVTSIVLFTAATLRSLEQQTWRAWTYALGIRHRDALLKNIVQSSTDCIICVDDAGVIETVNPAASRLFEAPSFELVGQPVAKFITLLAGEGAGARLAAMHGQIRECDVRTARGEIFPVEVSVSRVRLASPDARQLYTAIVRDIRERRAQQRRLQHQATHDSLTGLPNRAALMAHLDSALTAGPAGMHVALLMLDLCRFKEVNDTLGHNVGDRVLCDVAQRFARALGGSGLIARIGGDEFTVVLDRPSSADAIATTSQALADCLRAPIDVAGISIEVGVSIGIARFPQDAADAQTLLRHADVAMYVAKRRGIAHQFYDAAHDENTVGKLAIGGELRAAIAGNQLALHFQPQVNLRTGLVESCEALMRWVHPTQGPINPDEFIAIAESTDLIRPLTEWTLSAALAHVRAWRERGVHVRVAVNLSARLLQDTAFPNKLRALLDTSGVAASALELEVTESAMMLDPARALRVIQDIDRIGVLISIDDFGTGYSSLGYLRDLPVKALKLDKSFVMGMRGDVDDRVIVESTAQMARALKLELVAEGVESEWDARFLKAAGYDFAQGFHYSRALPADQFMAWTVEHNATAMLTPDTISTRAPDVLSGAGEGFAGLADKPSSHLRARRR